MCHFSPHGVPGIEVGELYPEHSGLQLVQTRVVTHGLVVVLLPAAVDSEHPGRIGQGIIVGGDHAPVTEGIQVLGGEEAVAAEGPHGSGLPALPGGPEALGTVFDDLQAMLGRHGLEAIHVAGAAEEVHRNDRLGAGRDGRLDQIGIDVEGAFLDVHEDRRGAHVADRLGGGKEGEGRGDHFVTGTDPQGPKGDVEGIGPGIEADGVLHAQVGGAFGLEGLLLGTEDELAGAHDPLEGGVEFLPVGLDLGLEIENGGVELGGHDAVYLCVRGAEACAEGRKATCLKW